jgi:hypothetical protein
MTEIHHEALFSEAQILRYVGHYSTDICLAAEEARI